MLYSKCRHFWILTFGEFRTVCLGFWISLPPPPFSSSPPLSSLLFLRKIREKEHFAPPSRSLSPPATYYDVTNKRKEERRRPKCISVYFLFLPTSGENRSTFFPISPPYFPEQQSFFGGYVQRNALAFVTYVHTHRLPTKKEWHYLSSFPLFSRPRREYRDNWKGGKEEKNEGNWGTPVVVEVQHIHTAHNIPDPQAGKNISVLICVGGGTLVCVSIFEGGEERRCMCIWGRRMAFELRMQHLPYFPPAFFV